jgi:5-formyltetrahydrofolate cyclo-ligase
MNQTKQDLRRNLRSARYLLSPKDYTLKSRKVVDNILKATDWDNVNSLHFYDPITELLEPDISGAIVFLEDKYPDMALLTTRNIDNNWETILARGETFPTRLDVIIVPMLGFDKHLNRLGYGGGFYDRFLIGQGNALKIGVCFESGRLESMPVEPHDIAMDLIITENPSIYM